MKADERRPPQVIAIDHEAVCNRPEVGVRLDLSAAIDLLKTGQVLCHQQPATLPSPPTGVLNRRSYGQSGLDFDFSRNGMLVHERSLTQPTAMSGTRVRRLPQLCSARRGFGV